MFTISRKLLQYLLSPALFAACCYSTVCYSTEAPTHLNKRISLIIELINLGEAAQAYQLAEKLADENIGLADFDIAYGLAAKANGHHHKAVFAFERAVILKPGNLDVRFALAVSYLKINKLQSARVEFNQVIESSSNQQALKLARSYLEQIEYKLNLSKSRWIHAIKTGFGFDSNVNSGAENEFVDIPLLGRIRLLDPSRETDDSFYLAELKSSYLSPVSLNTSWYGMAKVKLTEYSSHDEYSRVFTEVYAGIQSKFGDYTVRANLFYRPLWLDESKYLDFWGVKSQLSRPLGEAGRLGATLVLARQDYQTIDSLDENQWITALWYGIDSSWGEHTFTLTGGAENARDKLFEHSGRDLYGVSYRWQQRGIFSKDLLALRLSYLKSDFHQINPLFNTKREDEFGALELDYQYKLNRHWTVLTKLSYLDNSSNQDVYKYHRGYGWLAVSYQF